VNLPRLVQRSLAQRPLSSILTALNVALGVMLVVAIFMLKADMEEAFARPGRGYSLVVGPPKGSKLQLVLNTIFHVETSPGLVPFSVVSDLEKNRYVRLALPYAVGDTFQGFRVIATTPRVFDPVFPHPEGATADKFASGGPFRYDPAALTRAIDHILGRGSTASAAESEIYEAVVGMTVAERLGVSVGDRIEPTHGVEGIAHGEAQFWKVTGILKKSGTPVDRVVFINLDSFYRIPDHGAAMVPGKDGMMEGACSAVVVFPTPGIGKALLYPRLQQRQDASVADVNEEIRKLFALVGNVDLAFRIVALLVVVIGVISILVAIYNTMNERRREIAILRAIGARRRTVMAAIVGEATILAFLGGLFGMILAHGIIGLSAGYVEAQAGFRPDPFRIPLVPQETSWELLGVPMTLLSGVPIELLVLLGVTIAGAMAGLIPAWKAYRTDVASNLTPLS
jgi:putative ABC transport system permease protein